MPDSIESNSIKASYPDGECPDCGEPIPSDVQEGDTCCNCGHTFCIERNNS